jgi:Protein of unknown function (DUF4019)
MKSRLIHAGLIAVMLNFTALVATGAAQDLSAGVAARPSSRELNITSDSAPGWQPSAGQMQQVFGAIDGYFSALDQQQYQSAFAMMAEINRKSTSFAQFAQQNGEFHQRSGLIKQRSILKVTWTKDPAAAPAPGVYAAVDIASRFANVDRHCGFVILYQRSPGQNFEIMRQESNFIDNATAQNVEQRQSRAVLDQMWTGLAKN